MSSRNALAATPGPSRPPNWSSHLRQFSRTSLDRPLEQQPPPSPDAVSSHSNSTIREHASSARLRPERRWTVTVNESFARDEVLLNLDLIGDDVKPGSLVALDVVKTEAEKQSQAAHHKQHPHDRGRDAASCGTAKTPEGERRYICVAKDMPKELKTRHPNVEVYVAKHIADVFGMRRGTQITLTTIDVNIPAIEASHVELSFKDQYLSRADMWRLAVRELSERTVYKGQFVLFLGTIRAQVTTVYVDGRKVQSAFFGSDTKPIFRSESARYVLFIQMAHEMWDFDSDGSGEIIFNKVVNGFLPALFKKWAALKVKHLVTIVLFARVEYDMGISAELANTAAHNDYFTGIQPSGDRRPYKDFYRVVVSEMASGEWTKILYQLKREFNYFRKAISTHHLKAMGPLFSTSEDPPDTATSLNRIKAEASKAIYGNFLEAINMASSLFAHDYVDRDLMRTGISVVVISPSPGVFEVEYESLRRTTEALRAIQSSRIPNPKLGLDGSVHIENLRLPETLFDHVWGFNKFTPDKNSGRGGRSLWKQLQDYDDSRARLPTSRRAPVHLRYGRDHDDASRRQLLEDTGLLGTSYAERRASGSQPGLSSLSSEYNPGNDRLQVPRIKGNAIDYGEPHLRISPTKPPKVMRQISLGNRGFGIAAPKAATAALSVESATASKTPASAPRPQVSRMTPIKSNQRPDSPQRTSVGTPTFSAGRVSPLPFAQGNQNQQLPPNTPTRPIVIKSQQQLLDEASESFSSGSMLSSTLRADRIGSNLDLQYSNAIRAEDAKKVYNSKLLAGALPELPSTLSPKTAMSPWLTLLNPSNPMANDADITTLFSRWQHVFPRPSEMEVMKWKSLCSPAAVPLTTEYFPSKAAFESEYQRQPYNVSQNVDDELTEEPKSRDELLRELISLRFSQGFQIVVGPAVARAFGQKQLKTADVFSRDSALEDGTSVFMSVGNTIHQLSCVNGSEVEVNIFVRKPMESFQQYYDTHPMYRPAIRTLLDNGYETGEFDLVSPKPERNWNYIDSFVAGHNADLSEQLRFWRARFILIPMTGRHPSFPRVHTGDSEEEIRIEGIRKLAQMWQKFRYIPPNERRYQNLKLQRKKDLNPLDIIYKTDDPSVVIAAELETLPLLEGLEGGNRRGQLVRSREQFQKKNFSLAALAEAIQQPVENGGVRMQNRRWHLLLHYNCFIGSDMTSWLLENFEDLEDREEAEALGKRLMATDEDRHKDKDGSKENKKESTGLFVHVEKRHAFRDGQYFYQITGEYAKPHPPSWFNSRRTQMSIPSTPLSEHMPRDSPRTGRSRPASIHEESSPTSGTTTPTAAVLNTKKPKVVLSKVMKYDVDHRKRSYRPEIVELHYDRLHNPDNCYHIRVDWMNVTAKLIEDAVENWAREAAPYGLRLVEVPIAEACSITDINPFRRPYVIRLAVPPPDQQPVTYYDPHSFVPQAQPGRHFYQKAILRKFDYVLDVEAASNFPPDVDVTYSWGKPDFRFTQYIHRTGVVQAEITDEGDILLLANRLYSNRAATAREREVQKELRSTSEQYQHPPPQPPSSIDRGPNQGQGLGRIVTSPYTPYGIAEPTPISSPSFKPAFLSPVVRASSAGQVPGPTVSPYATTPGGGPDGGGGGGFGTPGQLKSGGPGLGGVVLNTQEPEVIKDELESFCLDGPALDAFYKEQQQLQQQARLVVGPAPPSAPASVLTLVPPSASTTPGVTPGVTPGFVGLSRPPGGVLETNIPTLGLPPAVLAANVGVPTLMGTTPAGSGGWGAEGGGSSSFTPRVSSPAMMQASQMFGRRGINNYQIKRAAHSAIRSESKDSNWKNFFRHTFRGTPPPEPWSDPGRLEDGFGPRDSFAESPTTYSPNGVDRDRPATENGATPSSGQESGDSRLSNGGGSRGPQLSGTDARDQLRRRATGKDKESSSRNGTETATDGKKQKKQRTFFKHIEPKEPFTVRNQIQRTIFNSYLNILLVAAPAGIALNYIPSVSRVVVFIINFIAIVPLAAMLSFATEEIALRTGETLGGLLNATFGNAVELIVAVIALVHKEVVIVQTSLIGSILSNLLLVMGMCFFFGGLRRQEQYFNTTVAQTAASLLALAVAGVIVPTVFDMASPAPQADVAKLSRGTSLILLFVYGGYLLFQLKTHSAVFAEESQKVEARPFRRSFKGSNLKEGAIAQGFVQSAGIMGGHALNSQQTDNEKLRHLLTTPPGKAEAEEEEGEEPQLHFIVAIATLAISTIIIAFCAEYMVDGISAVTAGGTISAEFVGLILLPIVGNAAEHATAVTVAIKDKMDLAIGVAVGSSMQVALFIIPLLVIIGWGMGMDDMNLSFDPFQVAVLFVAVLLVNYLIADGKSHWLEGMLLICLYAIIAVCSWWYPTDTEGGEAAA
ncbi:putative vacuolar membrane-associated protein [Lasiosphaeria hispida]|uniref:Vacuolar membrane-associated protein IML1 n=1 Tax=Lasiosphaeria hispida TaxID=260671 RepID=A0AAJ0HI89_9PEZI|nr:putative vacuolar membrane-associated protein [Lasiosphaeria hispida]